MPMWQYELQVPRDVVSSEELAEYRSLAIATWRTAAEASGGRPGEPEAILVEISPEAARPDPVTGEPACSAWRVLGPVD
ncbi:hypothetical protein ACL02T_17730 [Pseudonocardia sp. RS010]|uniref:hypothetical protein n=1 Tax=Pseudonocardia sp. RS010 TaxID=3385979 RepID=UPI0039A25EF0